MEFQFELVAGEPAPWPLPPQLAGKVGAVVTFTGLIRGREDEQRIAGVNVEAYAEMAREEAARIADEAARRWPLFWLAIRHRLGPVPAGAAAVWVATAAERRAEAYAANVFVMDALKSRLPIWKRGLNGSGRDSESD